MNSKHRFTAAAGAVVLAVGLALSGWSGGVSQADGPGDGKGSGPTAPSEVSGIDSFVDQVGKEFLDNQALLGQLKSWIIDQPGTRTSGYIDQVNYAENRSVRLLWYGKDAFLDKVLAKAASLGITASVEYRSQSLDQIRESMRRLWDSAETLRAKGFVVTSIAAIGADDNGIELDGVFVGELAADPGGVVRDDVLARRASVEESAVRIAGAPVVMVESDAAPALAGLTGFSSRHAGLPMMLP